MIFNTPLQKGIILKRYKRFLADIELPSKEIITVHVPNTGSMSYCWKPMDHILLSLSDNQKRKYPYTLEMVHNGHTWIGINTHKTNHLVEEAIINGTITEFSSYKNIKREVPIDNGRIDFCLDMDGQKCFIEVKNVTLVETPFTKASFPDAITQRGQKHLKELIRLKKEGYDSAIIFVIQREDAVSFSPNENIDPEYAKLLREAHQCGVNILPYICKLDPKEIKIVEKVPLNIYG